MEKVRSLREPLLLYFKNLNADKPHMEKNYPFKKIEKKWQKKWETQSFLNREIKTLKHKYYLLEMFPYPSGRIHMGHVRNYSIGDVMSRYKVMNGWDLLHPMGWDAFGLPAENAALKQNIHPARWTDDNIGYMRQQLKKMGFAYDWQREISTADSEYYKWNQWIFLQLYKKGLAYQRMAAVNWCPECTTVLANEQVEGGNCWRCGSLVESKEIKQWFFKITSYAEDLLNDLSQLNGWPDKVKIMQQNWVGRSEGVEIYFRILEGRETIPVFTTRQDTIFGATYLVLSAEHPMALELLKEQKEKGLAFIEKVKRERKNVAAVIDLEKEGVFTGRYAVNPVNEEKIPIWIANYVLMEYGTGAVMAVPTHDQRDFEFARKYKLPMRVVIQNKEHNLNVDTMKEAYEDEGELINSGQFNGLFGTEAKEKIALWMEDKKIGKRQVHYRLKDWGISRQRYWGTPIPIIYCEKCGTVPVPEKDLPVNLPRQVEFVYKNGISPLATDKEFYFTACPKCGTQARREIDTMDTFVDSSWYFLRFTDPGNRNSLFSSEKANYWMPVDQYIGGVEHAVMHLLYARFIHKFLSDLGLVKVKEPFSNLLTQGMVIKDGYKMSKSKGNVVDPDDIIERYGADTARLFILFSAPPEQDLEWSDQGINGAFRFLNRVWRLVNFKYEIEIPEELNVNFPNLVNELEKKLHKTIKKVTGDIERFHFNTAISAIMELINLIYTFTFKDSKNNLVLVENPVVLESLKVAVLLLSPFVPHISEEIWEKLGGKDSIFKETWPAFNPDFIQDEKITLVIQINGKVRDKLEVQTGLTEEEIKDIIFSQDKIKKWVANQEIVKTIIIPKKLVNLVVKMQS